MKKILQIMMLLFLINAAEVVFSQPPPPPPDPEDPNTGTFPPGWVGKSPVGDGYLIMMALGAAYAYKKYRNLKKIKKAESN